MRLDLPAGRRIVRARWSGIVAFDRQWTNSRHRHGFHEVCLALSGVGRYHHGGREWSLTPGDVFLALPEVVHEIASPETRDLRIAFFAFSIDPAGGGDSGDGLGALVASLEAEPRLHAAGAESLIGPASRLAIARTDPWAETARHAGARWLLTELLAACAPGAPVESPGEAGDPVVERARREIDAAFGAPFSIARLADRVGVSERTLRRRFEATLGHGPREEARRRGMVEAAHLLLRGHRAGEVAAIVGLDPTTFARTFRAVHGMTPREFTRSYRPGANDGTTMERP